jgi:threonyl-tRNA synthetase
MMESKNQTYKLERLAHIPITEKNSLYMNIDFMELCRGEHVSSTKEIGAVKLLGIAGACYRGSDKDKQLQRIPGTVFASKKELDEYLTMPEEAKQRDHCKLGKELKLSDAMISFENTSGIGEFSPTLGSPSRNATIVCLRASKKLSFNWSITGSSLARFNKDISTHNLSCGVEYSV